MKGIITTANKAILQDDGSEFLDVTFDIMDANDVKIDSKRVAFPLDTPAEDIQSEIAKYIATFEADAVRKEENKERDATLAKADATIVEIVGKEVAPSESEAAAPAEVVAETN